MVKKVRVGCKARILMYQKFSWYEKMKYNILHQKYSSRTTDKAEKIDKLRSLFGADSLSSYFPWNLSPEGQNYWQTINHNLDDLFPSEKYKVKEMDTSKMGVEWKL